MWAIMSEVLQQYICINPWRRPLQAYGHVHCIDSNSPVCLACGIDPTVNCTPAEKEEACKFLMELGSSSRKEMDQVGNPCPPGP